MGGSSSGGALESSENCHALINGFPRMRRMTLTLTTVAPPNECPARITFTSHSIGFSDPILDHLDQSMEVSPVVSNECWMSSRPSRTKSRIARRAWYISFLLKWSCSPRKDNILHSSAGWSEGQLTIRQSQKMLMLKRLRLTRD